MVFLVYFLLFILSVIGATHVLVDSVVAEPFRKWIDDQSKLEGKWKWYFEKAAYIVNCYQCAGVWVGWFCGFFLLTTWCGLSWASVVAIPGNLMTTLFAGFAGSFLAQFAGVYLEYLRARSII